VKDQHKFSVLSDWPPKLQKVTVLNEVSAYWLSISSDSFHQRTKVQTCNLFIMKCMNFGTGRNWNELLDLALSNKAFQVLGQLLTRGRVLCVHKLWIRIQFISATRKFMSPHDVQKVWTFSERVWPSKTVDQIRATKTTSMHMARKQIRNNGRKCCFISEYYLVASWNCTSGNG